MPEKSPWKRRISWFLIVVLAWTTPGFGAYEALAAEIKGVPGTPFEAALPLNSALPLPEAPQALPLPGGSSLELPPTLAPAAEAAPQAQAVAEAARAQTPAPAAALPVLRTASQDETQLSQNSAPASGEQAAQKADFNDGPQAPDEGPSVAGSQGRGGFGGRLAAAGRVRLKAAGGAIADLFYGDRQLAYIQKENRREINHARNYLLADVALTTAMGFLLKPLVNLSAAAAAHPVLLPLTMVSAGILGVFAVYVYAERQHVLIRANLGLAGAAAYRVAVVKNLLRQEMDFFQAKENSSGTLGRHVLGSTNYLSLKNIDSPLSAAYAVAAVVAGAGLLLLSKPALGVFVLAGLPVLRFLIARYGDRLAGLNFQQSDVQAELYRVSEETYAQIRTVKAFANEPQESRRYAKKAAELRDLGTTDAEITAKYMTVASMTSILTNLGLFILGGWMMSRHSLTLGGLMLASQGALLAAMGFSGLASAHLMIRRYAGSSKVVRGLIDRQPELSDAPDAAPAGPLSGKIAFDNVSFAYPRRKTQGVLHGVSFEAEPGQTIAFVGETGSGKSTIARLLLGFWEPGIGKVLYDGKDLKSFQRASVIEQIGVVPQDAQIFKGTLRFNLTYGAGEVSDETLKKAVAMAGAKFVENRQLFDKGLDTEISTDRLSGGEAQRVTIVRALLRNPRILILDEATAALDNTSENVVQETLDHLARDGRKPTAVVIAHRLTTIMGADKIFVLDNGRIVESGAHSELLAKGGRYASLWSKQLDEMQEAAEAKAKAKANAEAQAEAEHPADAPAVEPEAPLGPIHIRWTAKRVWLSVKIWFFGDRALKEVLAPYRWQIRLTSALLIVGSGLNLVMSSYIGKIIDYAQKAWQNPAFSYGAAIGHIGWLLAGLAVAIPLVSWASTRLSLLLPVRVLYDLETRLNDRLLQRENAFHLTHDSGQMASRLSEGVDPLAKKNTSVRLPILKSVLIGLASAGLLIHASPIFGGLMVLATIPLGYIAGKWGQKVQQAATEFDQKRSEFGRGAKELFQQITTIKTFGQELFEIKRTTARAQALVKAGIPRSAALANAHAMSSALTDLVAKYGPYIIGVWMIVLSPHTRLTIGAIIAMTFYAGILKDNIDSLTESWMTFQSLKGESAIARRWLHQEPRIKDGADAKPLAVGPGSVRIEGVDFRYSEAKGSAGVHDLNIDVAPGQTVAFVGESGSGKSTTLKLVQREEEPQSGRILVDGQDVKSVTLRSLKKDIAVVPQTTRLFDDTLRYNMIYGNEDAGEVELLSAIRAAKANFAIDESNKGNFPDGLDTRVGEGGTQLSGGQAQRVAIVRAILSIRRGARILLLDEATSKLDKKTEKEIQETLDHVVQGEGAATKPTTLVVAHNLTTIMGADKIIVFDKGRIVETGTHGELLARRGYYYRLWTAAQKKKR